MDQSTTVCFTGYRPEKMPEWQDEANPAVRKVKEALAAAVSESIDCGYTHFITGAARGFDLWAGECVLALKAAGAAVTLECALPFAAQATGWSHDEVLRYRALLAAADRQTLTAKAYEPGCYDKRNRYMVDHASRLITFFDGRPGGTKSTVRYAEKAGLEIINLYDDGQLFFL